MIQGIHHFALILSSEKALDFYKALGFRENFRKTRTDDTVVLLYGYGIQLEIFIDNRHPAKASGSFEPLGLRHVALKVDNLENEIEMLRKRNLIEIRDDKSLAEFSYDWKGVRYVFLNDIDGNVVELHE